MKLDEIATEVLVCNLFKTQEIVNLMFNECLGELPSVDLKSWKNEIEFMVNMLDDIDGVLTTNATE